MRLRLTDGHREVEIRTDDTADDPALLRQIERTARRLLDAMPAPRHTTSPTGFGFGRHLDGVALDTTLERADPDDTPLDDEDPPA